MYCKAAPCIRNMGCALSLSGGRVFNCSTKRTFSKCSKKLFLLNIFFSSVLFAPAEKNCYWQLLFCVLFIQDFCKCFRNSPHASSFFFTNKILFLFFLYLWSKKTRLAALNVLCIRSNFQQIAFCLKPQVSLLWCSLLNATQSAVYSIRVSLKYDIALWSWIVEFFNFICGIHTMCQFSVTFHSMTIFVDKIDVHILSTKVLQCKIRFNVWKLDE